MIAGKTPSNMNGGEGVVQFRCHPWEGRLSGNHLPNLRGQNSCRRIDFDEWVYMDGRPDFSALSPLKQECQAQCPWFFALYRQSARKLFIWPLWWMDSPSTTIECSHQLSCKVARGVKVARPKGQYWERPIIMQGTSSAALLLLRYWEAGDEERMEEEIDQQGWERKKQLRFWEGPLIIQASLYTALLLKHNFAFL